MVAAQRGKLAFPQRKTGKKPQAEHQVDVSVAFDGGVSSALEPGSSGMWACGKGAQGSGAGELLTLCGSSELRQELEDEHQQAERHSLPCPQRHCWRFG